jgi:membrane protein implicated in regulation of membrane protease activity
MNPLVAVVEVIVFLAGAGTYVAQAAYAPLTATWRISIPHGILRVVEVCMLIAGVATLAVSPWAKGTAGAVTSGASAILIACWFVTRRARRRHQQREEQRRWP